MIPSAFLQSYLQAGALIALGAALLGGVISAFNPCCLPMIPAAVLLASSKSASSRFKAVLIAASFVLGFACSMAVLGFFASGLGHVFGQTGGWFLYGAAAVMVLMALNLLDIISFRLPMKKAEDVEGHFGAFATGFLFSLVVAPCATPILASIVAFAAVKGNIAFGTLLLFVYGIGAGVPLVVMGSFMGLLGGIDFMNRHRKRINALIACLLVIAAARLVWNAT